MDDLFLGFENQEGILVADGVVFVLTDSIKEHPGLIKDVFLSIFEKGLSKN